MKMKPVLSEELLFKFAMDMILNSKLLPLMNILQSDEWTLYIAEEVNIFHYNPLR